MHFMLNGCMQKLLLPSTMRRIGEEIYSSASATQQKSSLSGYVLLCGQTADGQFLHSSDIHIRFLSTLIVLRTINQGLHAHFFLQTRLTLFHYLQVKQVLFYRATQRVYMCLQRN